MFTRHHKTTFITSAWPNAGNGDSAWDEKSAEAFWDERVLAVVPHESVPQEREVAMHWSGHVRPYTWSHHCMSLTGRIRRARLPRLGTWLDSGRRIRGSLDYYCFLNEFEFRAKLLKQFEMWFHFVLFKTKYFIFYQSTTERCHHLSAGPNHQPRESIHQEMSAPKGLW